METRRQSYGQTHSFFLSVCLWVSPVSKDPPITFELSSSHLSTEVAYLLGSTVKIPTIYDAPAHCTSGVIFHLVRCKKQNQV